MKPSPSHILTALMFLAMFGIVMVAHDRGPPRIAQARMQEPEEYEVTIDPMPRIAIPPSISPPVSNSLAATSPAIGKSRLRIKRSAARSIWNAGLQRCWSDGAQDLRQLFRLPVHLARKRGISNLCKPRDYS